MWLPLGKPTISHFLCIFLKKRNMNLYTKTIEYTKYIIFIINSQHVSY